MAKVQGLTIGIGADPSEFKKGMSQVNKELRSTTSEVSALQRSLKMEFNADTFAKAQKKAQDAISITDQKVQSLKNRMTTLEEAGKVDGNEYRKLEVQLTRTETQAVALKQKLEQIKELKIEELAGKFTTVGDSITKVGQALTPLSATAAGLLASFTAIASSAVSAGDEIGTVAQQLNISTDALQRWQYIAQQTDVDQSQLVNGIKKVQQALGNLAAGEVEATSDALRALGFTQEQATAGMSENFEPIINALANMEDATMQAYYANELFGTRMAASIIPMLNDGGAGLAALSAEFETMNYLTDQEVQSLDAFEDVLDKLKYQFETIKNQIGVALLPTFQALAETIETRILPAVQSLADKFSGLTDKQRQTILGTLAAVAALAPMLLIVGKLTASIGTAIKAVAGLSKVFTLLSAHPIIATIAAIAALIIYLYSTNEQFRESINRLVSTLGQALAPILDIVMKLLQQLFSVLTPVIDLLAAVLVPVIDMLSAALEPVVSILNAVLIPALNVIIKVVGLVFNSLLPVINLIQKVLVPVIQVFGDAIAGVFGFIQKGIELYLESIDFVANKVIDFINGMIRGFNKLGSVIGVTFDELDNVDISSSINKTVDVNYADPDVEAKTIPTAAQAATEAVTSTPSAASLTTVNNQDNSTQQITIEEGAFQVNNYAEGIDAEALGNELFAQLNLRLGKSMV